MRVWGQSPQLPEGLGAEPQRLAILGIYYQNNPFLGMFQLKFCPKIFETCLIVYVSVLKCTVAF